MARVTSETPTHQLKPEQATAAHTLDRHVSVTAGPGAGKTFVLVERYLEILRTQKVSVDNIVAITFTNRAANEMRERVRKQIDDLLRNSEGDARRRWLRHKRALEAAVITTIHGFCSRLLHEFPVEANVDPQFTLLDEHQSAMLLEAVVEEALTEAIQRHDEQIIQLAQGIGRGPLATALGKLYRDYRGEGLTLDEIESDTALNHLQVNAYASALKELDKQMAIFLSAKRLSRASFGKQAKAAQHWPALRAVLAAPPTSETIARYSQAIEDFRDTRLNKGSHPAAEAVDELLWGEGSTTTDCLNGTLPTIGFDLRAKEFALALLKLLRNVEERLESEKQKLSALDFDDLQLRTLKLLNEHPEVMTRIADRHRFFLVDEFQDTNGLQRDLMTRLALGGRANLFIVGDRKQSIYGFRGADVDVFGEMTEAMNQAGGIEQPLNVNFRSQRALMESLNFLFGKIFKLRRTISAQELKQLGYVAHQRSDAERQNESPPPHVELLINVIPVKEQSATNDSDRTDHTARDERERDAAQVSDRIKVLANDGVAYGDIAILFRALTSAWIYESELRRAGVPYLTVQGKGFYQREEIIDLIQLLRFLDNTTDELALAAVLRSPLCGLSDDVLLALRCAPRIDDPQIETDRLRRRNLLGALRRQQEIAFIDEAERHEVERARAFIDSLIERRNRYSISELLRYAVTSAELLLIIAANFDGAQRVANVEKLFRLAEQFEKSGNLIRNFVRYVEQFEAVGGRESEGQIDPSADVVRLMTIHQAKGLEYPVVIIPDLNRDPTRSEADFMLDRHQGFTVVVPDGRGQKARGALLNKLRQRNQWREEFESMRLLYVAATRAKDRLILSGAIEQKSLRNLTTTETEKWMAWIWQALDLPDNPSSEVLNFGDDIEFAITVDRSPARPSPIVVPKTSEEDDFDPARPFDKSFPLLRPVEAELGKTLRRFSVTQLINFQRCARQYYFDRLLRAPGAEERAVWNDAEVAEPPAHLTATLKGAVIHRFCEIFREGDDAEARLRQAFADVLSLKQSELAGRVFDVDSTEAIRDLMPLAQKYLASDVFRRVSQATRILNASQCAFLGPKSAPGIWSELRFRLRRPLGILTGTIDKLLITPAVNGEGVDIEIIDFKTNRFPARSSTAKQKRRGAATAAAAMTGVLDGPAQRAFDFESVTAESIVQVMIETERTPSIEEKIKTAAVDYQLQMQAYSLALRELFPASKANQIDEIRSRSGTGGIADSSLGEPFYIQSLRATLHFLDPNIEITLPASLLDQEACSRAIDVAMKEIAVLEGTLDASSFPAAPAPHCRMCNFLSLCPAGRDWLRD